MVPSGSAQLLLGHILRGLIYPLMKQWWSREERLFHLAELSVGEMDEKQGGRKGHPPGPLEQQSGCLHAPSIPVSDEMSGE